MSSSEGRGQWFDGRRAQGQTVRWRVDGQGLWLCAWGEKPRPELAPLAGPFEARRLRLRPSLGLARQPLDLPDGSTLCVSLDAARLQAALGLRPAWEERLLANVPAMGLCLLLLVAVMVSFDQWGAPKLASAAMPLLPPSVDRGLGRMVEDSLEAEWRPSQVPSDRQQRLVARFESVMKRLPPMDPAPKLRFAREAQFDSAEGGFNALTLPNGTVVLLDGLVAQFSDEELMAVLGHELGHLRHRHALRGTLRSIGLGSVAGAVLGDFSSVAANLVFLLRSSAHSRDDEREADADAREFLRQAGLPAATLVSTWQQFKKQELAQGSRASLLDGFASHPSTEERLRRAQAWAAEEEAALQALPAAPR